MEDSKIIELFYARSEDAIKYLSIKYGKLCFKIANNILNNKLDAEEVVSDAYLGVWNTIPPQNPKLLISYLCRIVRNTAINKYHANTAIKRNSIYDVALEEIEDCLTSRVTVEDEFNAKVLTKHIEDFLSLLDDKSRIMFVRRYYFSDDISDIARFFKTSNHYVSVRLSRLRNKLKKYLEGLL